MAQIVNGYVLSGSLLRTYLEWGGIGFLLLLGNSLLDYDALIYMGNAASLLSFVIMGCALRLKTSPYEVLNSMVIMLSFPFLLWGSFLLVTPSSIRQTILDTNITEPNLPVVVAIMMPVAMLQYLEVRFSLWLLRYGQMMRHKRLMWTITHSHILIIALVTVVTIVALLSIFRVLDGGNLLEVVIIFPNIITISLTIFFVLLLLVLVPLWCLSFIISRQITHRLETLTEATTAMRSGNYTTRIVVNGQDEIAQLQTDFNAMASELECVIGELQHERDRVAALLVSRRKWFANISHDLRTPLAILQSRLELMDQNSPTSSDFEVIHGQVHGLTVLVADLFDMAQLELNSLSLSPQLTNISMLLEQLSESYRSMAWDKYRISVIVEKQDNLPLLMVDPNRLIQILSNLISNSLKHTPPGGLIILSATVTELHFCIGVHDTGSGIPMEELPHIWETSYRTSTAQVQNIDGTGLGLAIVKQLTESMGGKVLAEIEEGTRITLWFPVTVGATT